MEILTETPTFILQVSVNSNQILLTRINLNSQKNNDNNQHW